MNQYLERECAGAFQMLLNGLNAFNKAATYFKRVTRERDEMIDWSFNRNIKRPDILIVKKLMVSDFEKFTQIYFTELYSLDKNTKASPH